MTRALVVLGLGMVLLCLEGALATALPRFACPDLSLLVAVAAGLALPGAGGCVAAWGVGGLADLLAGAPPGQLALLRLLAWGATRLGDQRLHLRQPGVLALFVAALTLAEAGLLALLAEALGTRAAVGAALLPGLLVHAAANGLAAPIVGALVRTVLVHAFEGGAARPALRLPARPAAS